MKIHGYAATEAKKMLESFTYDIDEVGDNEVVIDITHCGICHSDIHLIDNDWGITPYPLVPGHEIIGTISQVGEKVSHFSRGQRVGVGWQCGACMHCELCLAGKENLCLQTQPTCIGHFGGFATAVKVNSEFVFAIPELLGSAEAAPLLCAGITVYNSFRTHGVSHNMRVGVIGIGGLGHLGLQFAKAMGCHVTAISSSRDKEEEAFSFGAHHFISLSQPEEINKAISRFDFILSTVPAELDWLTILSMLKPTGKLCFVGIPDAPMNIPLLPLIAAQKTICGSAIGSRGVMIEMLDFCVRHNIRAKTQVESMSEVNEAINKVRNNQARYRIVLENV